MTNTETIGFELVTLNGMRTFEVVETDEEGNNITRQNAEPYFCKGISKTASVLTFTDAPSGYYSYPAADASFVKIYAKTSYGTPVEIGDPAWELVSYKSTPYGEKYKNESNWRAIPSL
jgi:hypothetical protein